MIASAVHFFASVHRLARRNHCSNDEKVTYSGGPATCKTFTGCGSNEVTYCALDGIGHQWAGSNKAIRMAMIAITTSNSIRVKPR